MSTVCKFFPHDFLQKFRQSKFLLKSYTVNWYHEKFWSGVKISALPYCGEESTFSIFPHCVTSLVKLLLSHWGLYTVHNNAICFHVKFFQIKNCSLSFNFFNRGKRKRRDSRHCLFTATFVVLEDHWGVIISRKNLPKLWVSQELLEMINHKKLKRHDSRYQYFHCYICGLGNNNWGAIIGINHKTTMLWKLLDLHR